MINVNLFYFTFIIDHYISHINLLGSMSHKHNLYINIKTRNMSVMSYISWKTMQSFCSYSVFREEILCLYIYNSLQNLA